MVYGGRSGEHEVSLASAASVFQNLDAARYEAVPIRIEKDGRWVLPERPPSLMSASDVIRAGRQELTGRTRETHLVAHPGSDTLMTIDRRRPEQAVVSGLELDVVFPVLHGPFGEDGTVQGLLELANVPYVGAGVLASSVGMDKAAMKLVFAAKDLPMCDYEVVMKRDWLRDERAVLQQIVSRLGFPVFVKPANLGSSVGISKAKHVAELRTAIKLAADFDRKIVVKAAVPKAREIEVAVLGNDDPEASVPGEIIPSREFYDYDAKYLDEGSRLLIPAPVDDAVAQEARSMAVRAFQSVDAAGMARVDFFMERTTGRLLLNELNTIPGFTRISMYPKLWEASGLPYPKLIERLVELAIERFNDRQRSQTAIDSRLLPPEAGE